MTWPYGLNLVTVTGTFTDASGFPLSGTVTFTPVIIPEGGTTAQPVNVTDASGQIVIGGQGVTRSLQPSVPPGWTFAPSIGAPVNVALVATDNNGLSPENWCYQVTLVIANQAPDVFAVLLPHSPSTADFSQLLASPAGTAVSSYVPLSGGTMSGTLVLDASPPLKLPSGTSGDVLTSDGSGNITLQPSTGGGGDVTSVNTQTGAVVLNAADVGAVDLTANVTVAGTKTFTGEVIVPAPVNATDAATKAYVDASSQGLSVKNSVSEATAAALPSYTYSNGTLGNGATLTGSSPGVLTVDGQAVALNDRVLVKNETGSPNAAYNGLYLCTTAGASGVAYVLTRTADMDTPAEVPGAFTFAEKGTVNADSGWVCTTTGTVTIGTTAIAWTQFSAAGTYSAGTGLSQSGNVFSLAVPVTVADGGTGQQTQQAALNALAGTVTSGQYLRGTGSNVTMSAIQAADLPAATTGGQGAVKLAGDLGGTGTSPEVLKIQGTAISAPPGGTTEFLAGNGTWQAPAGSGGFSNPMSAPGDMIDGGSSGTPQRLAGNTTTTKNFLTSTGTGSAATAPAWGVLASGDIPANAANTSGTAANLSGTPALPNGTTATTQSGSDSSTKLATTAFVQTVASAAETAAEAASDPAGTAASLLGSLYAGPVFLPTSGVPSSGLGLNGDYALDPIAEVAYGPKASGAWPAGTALSLPTYAGAPLTSGEATFLRETLSASATLTSGTLLLTYWTAVKSESSVAVTILSNATASSGLTYAAIGLYSVNTSTGALTLQASTPSTTTLCNAAFTLYKTDFSTPYSRTAGQEYAIGVLMVGATMPSLTSAPGDTNASSIPPRVSGALSGQSSLPSSISDSSLAATYLRFFATVTPS